MYEASLCSGCGQSTFLTFDPNNTGEWETAEVQCVACEVIDIENEHSRGDSGPGMKRYLINHFGETEGSLDG